MATSVPPVVYTIPPTSPLYYVTHVYVYGSTPQVVYTGYTPGYYGMVVTPSNLVVYGTGYVYPAWAGTVWYPLPATYGAYAAGYGAGVFTGFAFGMPFGAIAASAPWGWHGGCCWGGWHGGYANVNIYTRYGNKYYRAATGTVDGTRNSPGPRTPPSPARATTSTPRAMATSTGTQVVAGNTTIPPPMAGTA